ncbi:MAG: nuclear transport factor 2 family protein [Paucibacter sp.]|nr:nuclear transport factor 2 family protein [Roseateles sp.]
MKSLLPLLLASAAFAHADEAQMQTWQRQVRATECVFADSMAKRDLKAFESLLADAPLFFSGEGPLQGRAAVVARWKRFYEGAKAPFSWEPDEVVAVSDGSLAYSTGPVFDPQGQLIGRFASVWRQEAPGRWRIVIDHGVPLSDAERVKPPAPGKGCEGL